MNIKRTKTGTVTFITPEFPIIEESLDPLNHKIKECLERNEIRLVINLSQVPFIDSKGLEALLDYHNKIRKRGGTIKIANPNPLCNEILNITNMTTYFEIYFDLEKAGRSFL